MADAKAQIVLSALNRTRGAFNEVNSQFSKLQSGAAAAAARFGSLGALVTGAFAGASLAGAIDVLDQLDEIAEKSGIAVEQLSGLRFAGESVGTSFDDLAGGARRLAKGIADAAGGSKSAQAAFDAIGVAVKNTDGTLRETDQVLLDIADRFAGYEDGVGKAALAQELFGKSGETLIPLLNQGRSGIEGFRVEAEKLGVAYGAGLAKQAADFNDQLAKLKLASEGAAVSIAGQLLPSLTKAAEEILAARKNYSSFVQALGDQVINQDAFVNIEKGIEKTRQRLAELQEQQKKNPDKGGFLGFFTDVEPQIQNLQQRLAYLRELQRNEAARNLKPEDSQDALSRRLGSGAAPAPVVVDEGAAAQAAAERDRLLKAQLDARLKALDASLDRERDAYEFQNQQLKAVFAQGQTSLEDYYAGRAAAAAGALQAEQRVIDQQVQLLRGSQAGQVPAQRAETEGRINELLARRAKLEQDASQAGVLTGFERQAAEAGLAQQLQDVEAQILELGGNETGAALLRLEQQFIAVQQAANQLGIDPGIADRLKQAAGTTIELGDIRSKVSQVTESAAVAEERYLIQAERSGATLQETERGLIALRSRSLDQLAELAERAAKVAAEDPTNIVASQTADGLALLVERAATELDPAIERTRELAAGAGEAIAGTFGDLVIGGAKAGDAFANLAQRLTDMVFQLLVLEPLAKNFSAAISSVGSSSGSGVFGQLAGLFGVGAASGGGGAGTITGGSGLKITQAAEGIDRVPYDGFIAQLHKDEKVVPARYRDGGGGGLSVIVNAPPGTQVERTEQRETQSGREVEVFLKAAVDRAVAEVDRRIGSGGSTAKAMQGTFKGLARNTPRRS